MVKKLIEEKGLSSLEKNCKIVTHQNIFEVYSDTEKFGKNLLMYSNSSFNRCVEYISLASDEKRFEFKNKTYIIM